MNYCSALKMIDSRLPQRKPRKSAVTRVIISEMKRPWAEIRLSCLDLYMSPKPSFFVLFQFVRWRRSVRLT